jgi:tetratricopeptide (TPR) repeat protein
MSLGDCSQMKAIALGARRACTAKRRVFVLLIVALAMTGCQAGPFPIAPPASTDTQDASETVAQPEERIVQMSGTVQDVAVSARVLTIQVARGDSKYVNIQDQTLISFSDGDAAALADIQEGDAIEAEGKAVGDDSLLADKVIIRSGTEGASDAGSSEGQARILEAYAGYREADDPSKLSAVLESMEQGIGAYLAESLDPSRPASDQPEAIEGLRSALALGGPDEQIRVESYNQSGQDQVLVDTGLRMIPVLAFNWDGSDYVSSLIPPDLSLAGPEAWGAANGRVRLERVGDITGDGQVEIVVTQTVYGASAANIRLLILRWEVGIFETLFDRMMVEWAGPVKWELTPAADQEEIKLSYAILGVHDSKDLPHTVATELWRWDGTEYLMVSYAQSPPETRRQQFNLADVDFQRRDYTAAIAAYEKVIQDESLGVEEETAEVDWIALAHFRLGQCQAMLGGEERALQELAVAAESGPTLEDLAGAFSDSYQLPGGLVRAWGALQRAGLYQKVYEGQAGNLGAPVDAFHLLFPGGGVAAYLDGHPEVVEQGGDAMVSALGELGLAIEGAAVADLDGDGQLEVVFVTADNWVQHAWLAFRGGDRWLLDIAEVDESLSIGNVVQVGDGPGQAVTLRLPETVQPNEIYVTWDGVKPVRLSNATSEEVASEGSLLFQGAPTY